MRSLAVEILAPFIQKVTVYDLRLSSWAISPTNLEMDFDPEAVAARRAVSPARPEGPAEPMRLVAVAPSSPNMVRLGTVAFPAAIVPGLTGVTVPPMVELN